MHTVNHYFRILANAFFTVLLTEYPPFFFIYYELKLSVPAQMYADIHYRFQCNDRRKVCKTEPLS